MIKVTVTDRAGNTREYFFDDPEVTLGRLRENNIVLSRPNVSKRHAVLLYRDGDVFVKDLGSTNGTYVNGRRINQEVKVSSGDRIYVGDFIVRVEEAPEEVVEPSEPDLTLVTPQQDREARAATVAIESMSPEDRGEEGAGVETPKGEETVSVPEEPVEIEFELEEVADGEIEQPVEPVSVPEPPVENLPAGETREGKPDRAEPTTEEGEQTRQPEEPVSEGEGASVEETTTKAHTEDRFRMEQSRLSHSSVAALSSTVTPMSDVAEFPPLEYAEAFRRACEAVEDASIFAEVPETKTDFDDEEWNTISEKVLHIIGKARSEGKVPATIDERALSQDVLFEFAGIGALEELFADDGVRKIMVDSLDCIYVLRGSELKRHPKVFASSSTLQRILAKLALLAGIDNKASDYVEGLLPGGTRMTILKPPLVVSDVAMVFEKPQGSMLTPKDLVRAKVMDEATLQVLEAAVHERLNIVVCGRPMSGKTVFLNALLRLLPARARVVAIERRREVTLPDQEMIALAKDHLVRARESAYRIVTGLLADAIVLSDIEPDDTALLTSLFLSGTKGIFGTIVAENCSAAVCHLRTMVACANPGLSPEVVQQVIDCGVDMLVGMDLGGVGRHRVSEVKNMRGGGLVPEGL